jgi:uncharacterized membrane protein
VLRELLKTGAGRLAAGLTAALIVATAVALLLLWPTGETTSKLPVNAKTESAEVVSVAAIPCQAQGLRNCRKIEVRVGSGPDSGRTFAIDEGGGPTQLTLSPGDSVRVYKNPSAADPEAAFQAPPYSLADLDRRTPMLWLTVLFVVVVSVLGRRRGVMALAGLALSLAIVIFFVVPAILDGRPPLGVALVGAVAVMLATIALAHGVGAKSIAAVLGTTASLAVTVALAFAFTKLAHLTGFSSDEATLLNSTGNNLSFQGLVLAGMVIGALGVLDDVTVSQSSSVMALRRANPLMRFRELYREALDVGRDHVAATVNTLVLAYAGASLPILLVFSVGGTQFTDAVNGEAVAEQIVATLVGSIGLITAVPITTALAALLATRLPAERLAADTHAHVH